MSEKKDLFAETRLSYSSARLLQGCERKYWHYKINKTEKDADAEDSTRAFAVGKAFHYVLEESKHEKPSKIVNDLEYCVQNMQLEEDDVALTHAMVLKYLRLRKTQNLKAVGIELEIKNDKTVGYVDLVEVDEDTGLWWISDLKTAKTFWKTTIAKLPMDRQLNLYASFRSDIAKELGLDVTKWGGCRYKVTTKSTARQKAGESYIDYVKRLTDTYIKTYDIVIPKEKLRPEEVRLEHNSLHSRSMQLRNMELHDIPQNFGYCESYFKPCQYWSRCHGKCFSEMSEDLETFILD